MSNQSVPKTNSLYAQDYHLWLEHTVDLLNNKKFLELDLENLIEEIESMGRSVEEEFRSQNSGVRIKTLSTRR